MKKNKEIYDDMEQLLDEQLDKEAAKIQAEIEGDAAIGELSDEGKARIKTKLYEQVETYESERLYSQLSEEDRRALELGKQVMVTRRKKNWKVYIGLAAVLVMVLAVGITSVGGPQKFLTKLTQQVGSREVAQVDSGEDTAKSADEKEKEAYQQVEEEFGVASVRIVYQPKDMKFREMQIDKTMQTVDYIYKYNDSMMLYSMSLDYVNSSLGIDMDDAPKEEWSEIVSGCKVTIRAYETPQTKKERYNAQFVYKDVGYSLSATMEKEEFEKILKNLHFL